MQSDIVVIACSLSDETKGMFDKKAFSKMKSSSVLINIARGGIVNQDDLIEAIKVSLPILIFFYDWCFKTKHILNSDSNIFLPIPVWGNWRSWPRCYDA